MKIARDVLLVLFILLFVPVTQALSEIPSPPDWDGINTFFTNNPVIAVILAIPIICLVLILLLIHKLDKLEDTKAEKRHDELLKAIKDNRPIIFNRSVMYGRRRQRNL